MTQYHSPASLGARDEAARDEGPTIRRVNADGSVSVMPEESLDPSGRLAASVAGLRRAEADMAAYEEYGSFLTGPGGAARVAGERDASRGLVV